MCLRIFGHGLKHYGPSTAAKTNDLTECCPANGSCVKTYHPITAKPLNSRSTKIRLFNPALTLFTKLFTTYINTSCVSCCTGCRWLFNLTLRVSSELINPYQIQFIFFLFLFPHCQRAFFQLYRSNMPFPPATNARACSHPHIAPMDIRQLQYVPCG